MSLIIQPEKKILTQGIKIYTEWEIFKHKVGERDPDNLRKSAYEYSYIPGNLLLYEGAETLIELIAGIGTPVAYGNANARIGVGNGTAAAAATQTALQGASQVFVGMDATYPQKSGANNEKVLYQSLFADGVAEFAWEEFGVDNGAVALRNLNRKVQNQGTKVTGNEWTVRVTLTFA